jgi:hypothetical protein
MSYRNFNKRAKMIHDHGELDFLGLTPSDLVDRRCISALMNLD